MRQTNYVDQSVLHHNHMQLWAQACHFIYVFFQNNLADPKIASTNLLKYVTPIVSILNLI